jgi:O-antigen/teichoic acid export membrane protein
MNVSADTVTSPSEKHERQSASWDLRNAFRNYSTLVISQIVSAFFSFASVWLITHYIGTEGYGGVVAVIAASQMAQIFVNWTCVALARYGVEEFVESGKITRSFWARTFILLPNTIIFLIFSFLWLPILSNWLKLPPDAGWYVLTHFVVLAVWLHVQHALQGAKLPRLQGFLITLERVLIFLLLLILAVSGKITYLWAIGVYIVSPLIMIFIGIFQLRGLVSWRLQVDQIWLKKILKFSIPLIPFSFIGYFSTSYLDAIFISQYLSISDLGIYSIAYQINGILMQFPTVAGTLLLPFFVSLQSDKDAGKIHLYMRNVLPLLTFFGGLGIIITAYAAKLIIPLFFGQDSNQVVIIFWVLVSSSAFAFPGLIGYVPYFNSFSATYIATINAIVASVINLSANYFLIPRYGLKGCAWATVFAYGISFLVTMFLLRKKFKLEYRWIVPAIVPVILGSAYASWTENFGIALIISFAVAVVVILVFRKSFVEGLKTLMNFRSFLLKGN